MVRVSGSMAEHKQVTEKSLAGFWRSVLPLQAEWPLFAIAGSRREVSTGKVTKITDDCQTLAGHPGKGNHFLEVALLMAFHWLLPSWWLAEFLSSLIPLNDLLIIVPMLLACLLLWPWILQLLLLVSVFLPFLALEQLSGRSLLKSWITACLCNTLLSLVALGFLAKGGISGFLAALWLLYLVVNAILYLPAKLRTAASTS